jgi:hypothetical protein
MPEAGHYKYPPKFDKLEWQREHRKSHRQQYAGYLRDSLARLKDAVFKKLGDRCSNPDCAWVNPDGSRGCTDRRCLQIDHVHGKGNQERQLLKSGGRYGLYLRVLRDTDGEYQCLCANCNWIKLTVNREWEAGNEPKKEDVK